MLIVFDPVLTNSSSRTTSSFKFSIIIIWNMTRKILHVTLSVQIQCSVYLQHCFVGIIKVCLSALYVFVLHSKALHWSTVTASETTAKAFTNPFWGSCRETDPALWETITSYLAFQGWPIPTVCLSFLLVSMKIILWQCLGTFVFIAAWLTLGLPLSYSERSAFFIQDWSAVMCPPIKRLSLAYREMVEQDHMTTKQRQSYGSDQSE